MIDSDDDVVVGDIDVDVEVEVVVVFEPSQVVRLSM